MTHHGKLGGKYLEERVEGNPEEEDVGEELDQREGRVHHPVSQPLHTAKLITRPILLFSLHRNFVLTCVSSSFSFDSIALIEAYAGYKKPMKLHRNVEP